jgi:hypothetical protein
MRYQALRQPGHAAVAASRSRRDVAASGIAAPRAASELSGAVARVERPSVSLSCSSDGPSLRSLVYLALALEETDWRCAAGVNRLGVWKYKSDKSD